MLIHLYRCAFHNSQRLLSGGGLSCVMLLSSLLLCLQQACGSLGFLAELYLVSGSTLVLDHRTHTPHLARPCHPRCPVLQAAVGEGRKVGPLSPSAPLPLQAALKEPGTRLNEVPANCGQIATGTSQVCSLQTDARLLRAQNSCFRTQDSRALGWRC